MPLVSNRSKARPAIPVGLLRAVFALAFDRCALSGLAPRRALRGESVGPLTVEVESEAGERAQLQTRYDGIPPASALKVFLGGRQSEFPGHIMELAAR